jgi:predicted alpha/beta superfamily hydrolase
MTDAEQNIKHTMGATNLLSRTGDAPPVIIVGLASKNRMLDFSPTKDQSNPKGKSGGGEKFVQFIKQELLPYIESKYRTHPYRILAGHSMGGLFAGYVLMQHPDLFDAHIVMSPSFWWNKEEMVAKAKTFFKQQIRLNKTVYFGIGTMDGYGMRQELKRYIEAIKQNPPKGFRFHHQEFEGEGHMSAPLPITFQGLRFIFSDMNFPKSLVENYSNKAFDTHQKNLIKKYGTAVRQTGEAYFDLAYALAKAKNWDGAAYVFQQNIKAYPRNIWAMDYLGRVYIKAGKIDKAIATFEKAIKVSEKNGMGKIKYFKEKIAELKEKKKSKK